MPTHPTTSTTSQKSWSWYNVRLIEIDNFLFLINFPLFKAQIPTNQIFVNVTPELGSPQICTPEQVTRIQSQSLKILQEIQSKLECPQPYYVIPGVGSFLITLAGLLLEYPFIYFLDSPEYQGNCLGGVPLTVLAPVVQLKQEVKPLKSQSLQVLSCSIPTSLLTNDSRDTWLRVFFQQFGNRVKNSILFEEVSLSIEETTLSHVIL